jgi:hypothetical protein
VDVHKQLVKCANISSDSCAYIPIVAKLEPCKIMKLGALFAVIFPEGVLSPAEIYGFLHDWKADPECALRSIENWIHAQLQAKH